ncbi:LAFA_0E21308g1_1 [Lachancea sp. 'fantastica']|nr:LAFA_0E21308g1_1 [Lachancea sp. 'fantastica']
MLSGRRLSVTPVLRRWNSHLAFASSSSNGDLKPVIGQTNGISSCSDRSGAGNTLQSILVKRVRNEAKSSRPQPFGKHIDRITTPASRLSASIQAREYVKVLMELTLQSRLESNYSKKIFSDNVLTPMELSTLIQGLLASDRLVEKLIHVAPGSHGTEIVFNFYSIYIQTLSEKHLSPLQLHDLNQFLAFFIRNSQLRKAQIVLNFILASNDNKIPSDISTTIHYLQLRCGALPQNWPSPQKNLGVHNYSSRSKYKAFDRNFVPALIGQLDNPTSDWSLRINDSMETAIVYSLGFMAQLPALEKYINQRWGISMNSQRERKATDAFVTPSSEILISILASFARNGQIVPALKLMDLFIERYPDLELDISFWRRLFKQCTIMWDAKIDPSGQLSNGTWEVMKEWHYKRGTKVRPDLLVLKDRLTVLQATNNHRGAIEVIEQCLSPWNMESTASTELMAITQKYYKLVLKNQAASGCYHKSLRFIKKGALDQHQASILRSYFEMHRQKYVQKTQRRSEAAQQKIKAFDEEEEDDMLLGRLW